jgi:multimeric flavodoxin WrbA
MIRLREKEVGFCRSCFKCISKRTCLGNEDDMPLEILPKMLESDLILFASPSYYGTVTGLMKNFMDRCLPLQNLYSPGPLRGRPAVNIVIYGRSAGIHLTHATLDYWCLTLGMNVIRNYQFKAMDKNDASKDPSIKRQSEEIARTIYEYLVSTSKDPLYEQYPRIIVSENALTSAWKLTEQDVDKTMIPEK